MSAATYLLSLCLLAASVPSPYTPIAPGSLAPAPAIRSQTESRRLARHAHRLTVSGGAVLIASGLPWGILTGAMALGALERRRGNELVAAVNAADRPPSPSERDRLASHDRYGSSNDADAVVSIIVGAAMTIVGAALLGRGLVLKKRHGPLAPLRVAAGWRPTF